MSTRSSDQVFHLYVSTRTSAFGQFGDPVLATINSPNTADADLQPFVAADGEELWFVSTRDDGFHLYRVLRVGDGFGTPAIVPEFNSASADFYPVLSADRLTVYFDSNRAPPADQDPTSDIWMSHRSSTSQEFPAPQFVSELNLPFKSKSSRYPVLTPPRTGGELPGYHEEPRAPRPSSLA
jgi:hypothetical protein